VSRWFNSKEPIILFGCGGHSRSVADIILSISSDVELIFVDKNAHDNEHIFGFKVVTQYGGEKNQIFYALGNNKIRKSLFEDIGEKGLISVVSQKAHIGTGAKILNGCFVGNFCHIGPQSVIGENTIINNGAIIEHETKVGKHCHVGPNTTISGRCTIGDMVFVGVGATVKDGIDICANTIIGAGAVVVKDIVTSGVYVGCPAKRIR